MNLRRGFTLIELLVSISIMSLLIGILLPSLNAGREKARRVVCQSNLRQINSALWTYSFANEGRVPCISSPMTNGGGAGPVGEQEPYGLEYWRNRTVPGFGQPNSDDLDINPFDVEKWPTSLANTLGRTETGSEVKIFSCPSALVGWPRRSGPFRYTYREAAINQISGGISAPDSYYRESFGFLDGRKLDITPIHLTGNALLDSQVYGKARSTYLRDTVLRSGSTVTGPHGGGVNVITRQFEIEFRTSQEVADDLAPFGLGVRF
jgi:prepilin-type N-terminal cleavage/methylation domain-containing protein